MTLIQQLIISVGGGALTTFFVWFLNRPKLKAETDSVVVGQFNQLVERLNQERDAQEKRINANEKEIQNLKKQERLHKNEILTLKEDNEECKYLHEVYGLEMKRIKKQTDYSSIQREKVCVLDDDPDIIVEFQRKFSKLSVLDFEGFHDVDRFIDFARVHRPQIIVLDYLLNRGLTAEDVINDIGYEPEIFIMSGEKRFATNFAIDRIRFFEKDGNFIFKIVKAIIHYLISKG